MKKPTNQQEKPSNGETEVLDFNRPSYTFVANEQHDWRQQGYYLVCKSCEIQHAVWIGSEKMMTGLDKKGMPILKKRKELGMA